MSLQHAHVEMSLESVGNDGGVPTSSRQVKISEPGAPL